MEKLLFRVCFFQQLLLINFSVLIVKRIGKKRQILAWDVKVCVLAKASIRGRLWYSRLPSVQSILCRLVCFLVVWYWTKILNWNCRECLFCRNLRFDLIVPPWGSWVGNWLATGFVRYKRRNFDQLGRWVLLSISLPLPHGRSRAGCRMRVVGRMKIDSFFNTQPCVTQICITQGCVSC